MKRLFSSTASLLGRLQAVANNKAIEATIAAANNANTARIGTQTLVDANDRFLRAAVSPVEAVPQFRSTAAGLP